MNNKNNEQYRYSTARHYLLCLCKFKKEIVQVRDKICPYSGHRETKEEGIVTIIPFFFLIFSTFKLSLCLTFFKAWNPLMMNPAEKFEYFMWMIACYIYHMVSQNILRTHEGKVVFSKKKYPICDCFRHSRMH